MSKNFMSFGDAETLFTQIKTALGFRKKTWGPGTQEAWDALPLSEKLKYERADITNDEGSADFGTASTKDYTDKVRPNDHDLVESNAVYNAINNALSSIYEPHGDLSCAELTSELLINDNVGNVYQMSDSGVTSNLFINGAGITISANDSVGIIKAGQNTILFNYMGNAFDLHDYQKKDLAQAVESATTVEGALSALSTNKATQAEVNDIVNVLGAKNLLSLTLASLQANTTGGTWTNNTYVKEGITYTVYTNSSGFVTRINANGTTSTNPSNLIFNYNSRKNLFLNAGNYIISKGNTDSSAVLYWNVYNDTTLVRQIASLGSNSSQEVSIDYSNYNAYEIGIHVVANSTIDVDFYPMIRLASDPDNTYEPYAMTNQQITPYVQAISNPNLLDNPWFTVNQRGQSSYSGTSSLKQYVFDRWFLSWASSDVTVTKNSDGTITYTNNSSIDNMQIIQIIDTPNALANKQVTLSIDVVSVTVASGNTIGCMATLNASPWTSYARVNISSGGLYSNTGILGDASTLSTNGLKVLISLDAGESITFKAIKLELGSVSTLAMDTAPSYTSELLKCQRYFVRFGEGSTFLGFVNNSTTMYGTITAPVKMRIDNPSVTKNGTILMNWTGHAGSSGEALDTFTSYGSKSNVFSFGATIASSSLTAGQCAEINVRTDAYIDFSADL